MTVLTNFRSRHSTVWGYKKLGVFVHFSTNLVESPFYSKSIHLYKYTNYKWRTARKHALIS